VFVSICTCSLTTYQGFIVVIEAIIYITRDFTPGYFTGIVIKKQRGSPVKAYKPSNPFQCIMAMMLSIYCASIGQSVLAQDDNSMRPDNPGTGDFPAIKEEVASLADHVVYRPRDLDAMGSMKLGIVAWGNGGCSFDGASSRFHLLELASHGYLVIAGGKILSGPGAPTPEPGDAPRRRTTADSLTSAIDWAIAQNADAASPFYQRIDPDQIALSGFSCGGVQVNHKAADPRVKTLVMHNTGILNEPMPADIDIGEMQLGKEALADIHTPLIYILGGETDIAYENGMDDYRRLTHVPVAVANIDRGHGGTFAEENGGSAAQVAVNWLDWQLRGYRNAALYFIGEECGMCRNPEWTLERKFIGVVAP